MAKKLSGRRIAILATDGFEQSELADPRRALEDAGAATDIVSLRAGTIRGWKNGNWADAFTVDKTVGQANAGDYDALVLPGGVMNPDKLRTDADAVRFTRTFFEQGKPVGAICHGPWTLIDAGVVDRRRMTSWPSLRQDLINAGARWTDEEVVVDGELVTSRKPADIPAFSRHLIEVIAERVSTHA
jgi:protease I